MKYLLSATNVLLLANAALAKPMAALKQEARDAIRARNAIRSTNRFIPAPGSVASTDINGTAAVESSNWAGAAIVTSGVTKVSGTFTVPKPTVPSGGSSGTEYCGAAWVGIDGYSNADLIQTGVLWCVQNGAYEYEAWYEYLPASLVGYSGISVTSGSVVTVTATKTGPYGSDFDSFKAEESSSWSMSSELSQELGSQLPNVQQKAHTDLSIGTNSGVTTLSSGGQSVSHTFSGQSSPLPGASAEWIVEDFLSGNSEVPFANFGTVTFTGSSAVVNGATVTPGSDGATIIYLEENNKVLTSTTVSGGTVTVTYE